jgi:hypothetical protein
MIHNHWPTIAIYAQSPLLGRTIFAVCHDIKPYALSVLLSNYNMHSLLIGIHLVLNVFVLSAY